MYTLLTYLRTYLLDSCYLPLLLGLKVHQQYVELRAVQRFSRLICHYHIFYPAVCWLIRPDSFLPGGSLPAW